MFKIDILLQKKSVSGSHLLSYFQKKISQKA